MKKLLFTFILTFLLFNLFNAQVYTNKEVGKKNEELIDSLKHTAYPYVLPIWGEKATQKGFSLPYSAGIGINYLWQESDLIISDLMVGFNQGEMIDLDQIIRFDGAKAAASAMNIRPDIWLFPFLNVYAILGKANTSTEINAALWLPDTSDVWNPVSSFSTKANFQATTFGFGLTPTLGVGGGWMALDMNCAWTDVSALNKPVFTFVFGPRFGKTFKLKKPESNIAFWCGGFRVKFTSSTEGSINLSDIMPADELGGKIDEGTAKVEEAQVQVDEWWAGLTPLEQSNPINQRKYETYNNAIETASNILAAADGAISTISTSTVQYSLQKNLKDMWNFIVGTQFQLNKHWMVRAEYGFLGSRQQFIGGLQYRFGL
ncbi:MAG: hypothetical protein U0W24_13990 [Bacteroidales bacterium]